MDENERIDSEEEAKKACQKVKKALDSLPDIRFYTVRAHWEEEDSPLQGVSLGHLDSHTTAPEEEAQPWADIGPWASGSYEASSVERTNHEGLQDRFSEAPFVGRYFGGYDSFGTLVAVYPEAYLGASWPQVETLVEDLEDLSSYPILFEDRQLRAEEEARQEAIEEACRYGFRKKLASLLAEEGPFPSQGEAKEAILQLEEAWPEDMDKPLRMLAEEAQDETGRYGHEEGGGYWVPVEAWAEASWPILLEWMEEEGLTPSQEA